MPSASDEGCCSAANPYVPMTVAPFVLVFNIFGAGVGTLVASYYTPGGCSYKVMCCGIFQLLTMPLIVGWVWSIVQGCMIYNKSREYYCSQNPAYCEKTTASTQNE